jgi:hypothetical protein
MLSRGSGRDETEIGMGGLTNVDDGGYEGIGL